ncbi:MAG: cupin domain-containing protein [Rhodospirillales bacterium]
MIEGPSVNADLTKFVVIAADDMAWDATEIDGIFCKTLERVTETGLARESCLYKMNPGASFGGQTLEERAEIFVVYGSVSDGVSEIGKYTYHRMPPGSDVHIHSSAGCVIFFRRRQGRGANGATFTIDATVAKNFEPWGGRGSVKIPLEDPAEPGVGAWIGSMIPDLHIPNHDHAGGEEIFVVEGVIEDEYCVAGPRTWMRFPLGFEHSPFSRHDDVLMLVREGDVKI